MLKSPAYDPGLGRAVEVSWGVTTVDSPSLIVTSRLADERLWAEALNLGAYDVLAKPFDSTEAMRVVGAAWRAWGGPVRLPARQEYYKCKVATAAEAS